MPGKIHQAILASASPEDRPLVDWLYEVTRTPEVGVMLWGFAEAIAIDHPDWKFFEVLRELNKRVKIMKVSDNILQVVSSKATDS